LIRKKVEPYNETLLGKIITRDYELTPMPDKIFKSKEPINARDEAFRYMENFDDILEDSIAQGENISYSADIDLIDESEPTESDEYDGLYTIYGGYLEHPSETLWALRDELKKYEKHGFAIGDHKVITIDFYDDIGGKVVNYRIIDTPFQWEKNLDPETVEELRKDPEIDQEESPAQRYLQ